MNDKLRTSADYINIHELQERIRKLLKRCMLEETGEGAARLVYRLQNLINNQPE